MDKKKVVEFESDYCHDRHCVCSDNVKIRCWIKAIDQCKKYDKEGNRKVEI